MPQIPLEVAVEAPGILGSSSEPLFGMCPTSTPRPEAAIMMLANSKGKLENTQIFPALYFVLNMGESSLKTKKTFLYTFEYLKFLLST